MRSSVSTRQVNQDRRQFVVSASLAAGGLALGIVSIKAQVKHPGFRPLEPGCNRRRRALCLGRDCPRRHGDDACPDSRDRQWRDDTGRHERDRGARVRLVAGEGGVLLHPARLSGQGSVQRGVPALLRRTRNRQGEDGPRTADRGQCTRKAQSCGSIPLARFRGGDRGQEQRAHPCCPAVGTCATARSRRQPQKLCCPRSRRSSRRANGPSWGRRLRETPRSASRQRQRDLRHRCASAGYGARGADAISRARRQVEKSSAGGRAGHARRARGRGGRSGEDQRIAGPAKIHLGFRRQPGTERSRRHRGPVLAGQARARRASCRMGQRRRLAMEEQRRDL